MVSAISQRSPGASPGIVFFKYLLGMPIDDVSLCIELTDTALNGETKWSTA